MTLSALLASAPFAFSWEVDSGMPGETDPVVTSLTHLDTEVGPGALHFCIRGRNVDGHSFAQSAVTMGAVATISAYRVDPLPVPQIIVPNVRESMAHLARRFYEDPSLRTKVIGITGTAGKTSTSAYLHHILERLNRRSMVSGTLTGRRTTPDSIAFQEQLATAVDAGIEYVAAEITSHGLTQHRVTGTQFEVAVFLNLAEDHLDYHGDMESYFSAKARLFGARSRRCVVNVADPWGRRLADMVPEDRLVGVDLEAVSTSTTDGSLHLSWREHPLTLHQTPRWMAMNALMAAETAVVLGFSVEQVADTLNTLPAVPGRFERVDHGQPFTVVIDDARTSQALRSVCVGAREALSPRRLTVVIGAAASTSAAERRRMGQVASELADRIVVTTNNPGNEDPAEIATMVLSGIGSARSPAVAVIEDRAEAITFAIGTAMPGEVVIVAGKGHQQYQEIAGESLPFRDQEVARSAIRSWTNETTTR